MPSPMPLTKAPIRILRWIGKSCSYLGLAQTCRIGRGPDTVVPSPGKDNRYTVDYILWISRTS